MIEMAIVKKYGQSPPRANEYEYCIGAYIGMRAARWMYSSGKRLFVLGFEKNIHRIGRYPVRDTMTREIRGWFVNKYASITGDDFLVNNLSDLVVRVEPFGCIIVAWLGGLSKYHKHAMHELIHETTETFRTQRRHQNEMPILR